MRVLIAADNLSSGHTLESLLARWGYQPQLVADGWEAWDVLRSPARPPLALLDRMVPDIDSLGLCRRVRAQRPSAPPYLLLLTTRDCRADLIAALEAGANDYLTRPFEPEELRARLRVGERTLALHATLADRVRELEAAREHILRTENLRSVGQVAGGVAHDFNNLLSTILGRAQLLLLQTEDPCLRRHLELIERVAQDGRHTVARIQRFAGQSAGAEYEPADLDRLCEDALAITEHRWKDETERAGLTLQLSAQLGTAPQVLVNPAEIREVLVNLLLNACDAMPEGGALSLRTALEDDWGVIQVTDTGVGMDEATRSRVFDLFFTTKQGPNTGLGLNVVQGIIQRHGGHIEVESAPGQGATFTVRLPLSPQTSPPVSSCSPQADPAPALRVLLVDDDPLVLSTLREGLTTLGYDAVAFADGPAALRAAAESRFDVVLTDLGMPGMSGWQLAEELHRLCPDTPLLILTGWGDTLEPRPLVTRTLTKPVDLDTLRAVLAETVASPAGDGAAA